MFQRLTNWFRTTRNRPSCPRRAIRLQVELLEDRLTPSFTAITGPGPNGAIPVGQSVQIKIATTDFIDFDVGDTSDLPNLYTIKWGDGSANSTGQLSISGNNLVATLNHKLLKSVSTVQFTFTEGGEPGDTGTETVSINTKVPETKGQQLLDYAFLASEAYESLNYTTVYSTGNSAHWKVLQIFQGAIIYPPSPPGFRAVLFQSLDDNRVVLAFKGSDNVYDWINDIAQAPGFFTPDYNAARHLAEQERAIYGSNLILVGHSLGGGEAAYAGLWTSTPTVTFNAAGLSVGYQVNLRANNKLGSQNLNLIDQYDIVGDPVSNIGNLLNFAIPLLDRQFGNVHYLFTAKLPTSPILLLDLIGLHDIDQFVTYFAMH